MCAIDERTLAVDGKKEQSGGVSARAIDAPIILGFMMTDKRRI